MQNVLSILVFFPILAGVFLMLMPGKDPKGIQIYALVASLINLVFAVAAGLRFNPSLGGNFAVDAAWLPSLGIHYHMAADGISLLLVMLTAVLTPVAVLASWSLIKTHQKGYYANILALSGAMIGAVVSLDVFLFYIFFELMLVPAFFLIGIWGGPNRVKATTKFVVYTLVGSLFMLLALLYLVVQHQAQTGVYSFAVADLAQTHLSTHAMWLAFAAFVVAFGIKSGMFPFHTWAPDTYVEAPAPVTFLVAGVMGKIGIYGFIRFALPLFPLAARQAAPFLMVVALVGLIYSAWVALAQTDVKRLLAYSSISHMAVIMLGVFSLDPRAWAGSVFMFMAHAFATGGLFLLTGMLAERRGTQMSDFGGIAASVPLLTAFFVIVGMASVGLPGLNGFIGEFLILLGTFTSRNVVGVIATTSVIWGAIYTLWMVSRTFFGEQAASDRPPLRDLSLREACVIIPMTLVIVATGVMPQPVLNRIVPSVEASLTSLTAAPMTAALGSTTPTPGGH